MLYKTTTSPLRITLGPCALHHPGTLGPVPAGENEMDALFAKKSYLTLHEPSMDDFAAYNAMPADPSAGPYTVFSLSSTSAQVDQLRVMKSDNFSGFLDKRLKV